MTAEYRAQPTVADKTRTRALEANPNWKGGRTTTKAGYVLVKVPDHPDADVRGYVYEHRLVGEQMLGRRLTREERVRHRERPNSDNRPENLIVTSHWARTAEPNVIVACACGCGATFAKFDSQRRPRRFVSGHNVARKGVMPYGRQERDTVDRRDLEPNHWL